MGAIADMTAMLQFSGGESIMDPTPAKANQKSYRKFVSLGNGRKVMLKFLNGEDRQEFTRLFQEARPEDVRFLKENFKDSRFLDEWLKKVDYQRLLPLVAVDMDSQRLVANANLYVGKFAARHIGEISLYVSELYRNVGLGSMMVNELLGLAMKKGLFWLRVSILAEEKKLINAFRTKGFQVKATLEDFFMRQDGMTQDVVLMMRPVLQDDEIGRAHV